MELRILRAPCQRCGGYHDERSRDSALTALERQQIAEQVSRELAKARAEAPEPPDLVALIRAKGGGR